MIFASILDSTHETKKYFVIDFFHFSKWMIVDSGILIITTKGWSESFRLIEVWSIENYVIFWSLNRFPDSTKNPKTALKVAQWRKTVFFITTSLISSMKDIIEILLVEEETSIVLLLCSLHSNPGIPKIQKLFWFFRPVSKIVFTSDYWSDIFHEVCVQKFFPSRGEL